MKTFRFNGDQDRVVADVDRPDGRTLEVFPTEVFDLHNKQADRLLALDLDDFALLGDDEAAAAKALLAAGPESAEVPPDDEETDPDDEGSSDDSSTEDSDPADPPTEPKRRTRSTKS